MADNKVTPAAAGKPKGKRARKSSECLIVRFEDADHLTLRASVKDQADGRKVLKELLETGAEKNGTFGIIRILWRCAPDVDEQQVRKVTF